MNFECAYIPIGVPTFELNAAQNEFNKSVAVLGSICNNIKYPKEMLLSLEKLNEFLDKINPDLIIVQNITFANSAYICEIVKKTDCPIVLWTLREPIIDGGRLRLNSLTGAFSAGNALTMLNKKYEYVFGSPNENKTVKKLTSAIRAAGVKKELKNLKLLQIGHTPQGFGFGRASDIQMQKVFGVTLESIEARELIDKAKSFSDDDAKEYLNDAAQRINGLENTPKKNRLDFAKLYKAYASYCAENHIGAIASRCWPDFFTAYGTPVCAVLAMLNDLGISSACEADAYGALSMLVAQKLTGHAVFFGDPVSMDEKENTITFWHCGTAACSLAREDTGACADVHCNRKIGPTLDFGCKPSKEATILRIGQNSDGNFRIFISTGEILDKPKQFNGTSLVVKTENDAENIINNAVKNGWEPHFAVCGENIEEELEMLGNMLNIEVCKF